MEDAFNPYIQWLGLADAATTPNHYRLLGLPLFESEARLISSACDGMLAKVRGNRPGPHLRQWQALLDELTAARNCLLDATLRAAYDEQLRSGLGETKPAGPVASNAAPTGKQGYMWPPGFEPPGSQASVAPTPASDVSAPAATSSTYGQLAPQARIDDSLSIGPRGGQALSLGNEAAPAPNNPLTSPYAASGNSASPLPNAAATIPVLEPVANSYAAPQAAPYQSVPQPEPYNSAPYNAAPQAAPVAAPIAAPVAMPWNAAGSTPQAYSAQGYAPQGYGMPAAQPASPIVAPSVVNAPGMYGGQGADPMAPLAGPGMQSQPGSAPYAQPLGGYGYPAPVAQGTVAQGTVAPYPGAQAPMTQPNGNYGYSPYGAANPAYGAAAPAATYPVATGYPVANQMATAAPVNAGWSNPQAGMPVAGMPVSAMPVQAAMPQGIPQAMPVRATAVADPDDPQALGLNVPKSSTSSSYKQSVRKSSLPMVFGALIAASLLVVVAFMVALKKEEDEAKEAAIIAAALNTPVQPPPVIVVPPRNDSSQTTVMLDPLGADLPKKPPKRPRSTIGPALQPGEGTEEMKQPGEEMPEKLPLPEMKTDPKPEVKPEPKPEPEKPPEPMATPQQIAGVRKALGQSLVSMSYRDWETAKALIEEAGALAVSEDLKLKVEGVRSVHNGALEFWNGVREGAKGLTAGEELVIGNSRVAVVESTDKLLILRVAGMNKRYPINDLPMGLARSLAESWFDQAAPSTKIFTGAFLFVEKNGDPGEVRGLWQQAQQAGVSVDLLMPLLDDNLKADAKPEPDKS